MWNPGAISAHQAGYGQVSVRHSHRIGKWYDDLDLAQRFANAIGAGFLDRRSGRFVAYPGNRLERTNSEL